MEVTDEMRTAVLVAECERYGHVPNIDQAISNDPTVHPDELIIRVRADPGVVPHISCRRCGHVWLVIDDPGLGYDDAVAKMQARLHDPDSLIPPMPEHVHTDQALPADQPADPPADPAPTDPPAEAPAAPPAPQEG